MGGIDTLNQPQPPSLFVFAVACPFCMLFRSAAEESAVACFNTLYFAFPILYRSRPMKRLVVAAIFAFSCLFLQAQIAKPKVRAITAFVRLDAKNDQHQLADALTVLHKTEAEFQSQGYGVETIRFTASPSPT
jgi:hypothetical protein